MRRSALPLLAAGLTALLTLPTASAYAQNLSLVVPSSLAATEGSDNNSYPFNLYPVEVSSMRFQQVYSAAQFGIHRLRITALRFRPDSEQGSSFFSFIDDVQIRLSTTPMAVDSLSTTFAANVGSDDMIVYPRQNLTLSSDFTGSALGPMTFDVGMVLNNPFIYEPTGGNLLLDVRTFACTADTVVLDATGAGGDSLSRVYALDVNAATGTADTLGLITQFTAVKISTLSGRIELQQASNLGIPITFEFRIPNTNTRFARTVIPNGAGNFSIENIPSAAYEVAVKGSKWLQRTDDVDLTNGDVSGFNYTGPINSLRGGDANDDNAVDTSDLSLLIAHYNQIFPSLNYLDAADFNNDNTNDIADLFILIGNYNLIGDP